MARPRSHSAIASVLAILALVAATLLPAAHALHDDHTNFSAHAAAPDSQPAPHHDDDSPGAPHDEQSCSICQLIAITSLGIAPVLGAAPCPFTHAPFAIAAQPSRRAQSNAFPRSLPARGPPRA